MTDDSKTIEALQARVAELEAEQADSRERIDMLEFLLDQMPQFISYVSADRHFVFNNAKLAQWFARDTAKGLSVEEVAGPDAALAAEGHFKEAEASREPLKFYGPLKFGEDLRHLKATYNPRFHDDVLHGFGVVVQDVTQRRAREQRLRQAAVVFDAVNVGILLLNSKHEIVQVNPAFTELSGYTVEETLGKKPLNLKAPGRQEGILDTIWEAMRKEGHWQGELIQRRKDGSIGGVWVIVNTIADPSGFIHHYVAIISDLEASSSLSHLAHHDILTGLPNRLLLEARLQHTLERAHRLGEQAAVLFMDLDGFKAVNDAEGHAEGDAVLVEVARRLKQAVRSIDTVSRLGGDEFVIILDHVHDPMDAADVANRLLSAFDEPFVAGESRYAVGASIGMSLYPAQAKTGVDLIHHADLAMYAAKAAGKGCYRMFDPSMTSKDLGR